MVNKKISSSFDKPVFSFCVTNLDMYSGALETKLKRNGYETREYHCLGLCADCMAGAVALMNDRNVVNPENWLECENSQQRRKR